MSSPKKVAILGGGMSSMVTAFELTSLPNWREKFDITIYQTGWRLGGKGASGRNQAMHDRNEEHGLHVIFGFYDNVFRVMRKCYEELGRNPKEPLATWRDAFHPHSLIVMMEKLGEEKYERWVLNWPENDLTPGEGDPYLPPWVYLSQLLQWSVNVLKQWLADNVSGDSYFEEALGTLAKEPENLLDYIKSFLSPREPESRRGFFGTLLSRFLKDDDDSPFEGEHLGLALASSLASRFTKDADDPGQDYKLVVALVDRALGWVKRQRTESTVGRRARLLLNFSLAMIRGMIVDGIIFPPYDWFKIDHKDFGEWLKEHGAHPETVDSAPVHGVYTAVFSENNSVAAGTGLHALLRMALTYKGSYLWLMQGGMGDVVFAPLMTVLERRGVKFEFFHEVEQLHLSQGPGERFVDSIDFNIQAHVIRPPYQPLIDVKGLPCWPSKPLYDQLVEGEELRDGGYDLEDWWGTWPGVGKKTLTRGVDFDLVVLGISHAGLAPLCKELIEDAANPRFKQMIEGVKTVQIQSTQLWMHNGLTQLGWPDDPPVIVPYGYSVPGDRNPLDTWADMTHVLPHESWPESVHVGNLAYLTAGMTDNEPVPPRSDHTYPARQAKRVKEIALDWLRRKAGPLWPKAVDPGTGEFLWSWLVDEKNRTGEDRFEGQYWHAVKSLSERYVLAVKNSSQYRLFADESGYPNLFLTGDWIKTSLSIGCLEAATMAGVQTAHALDPRVEIPPWEWQPPRNQKTNGKMPHEPGIEEYTPKPSLPAPAPTPAPQGPRVQYIPRDGDMIASPPVQIDTTLYMFFIEASMEKLKEMCDQCLNIGGETVYRPLAPFVILYFSSVDNLPLTEPVGIVPEKDYGIWAPVVAGKMHNGVFVPNRALSFTPYIWVDNGAALIGGRSVFGFPKELGKMTFPERPQDAAAFALDTLVLPKFSPTSRAEERRLIEANRIEPNLWEKLDILWNDLEDMVSAGVEGLRSLIGGEPIRDYLKSLWGGQTMVFLKQLPAADDARFAVYQAVLESEVSITSGIQGGFLRGTYEIAIHRYDSHRIVETLGLRPDRQVGEVSYFKSILQPWMKFKAVVKPGKIIH